MIGRTVVLTTYRHAGTGVSTPVSIAIRCGLVRFVAASNSGKAKRLRRNNRVSLATSGRAHRATSGPIEGEATPVPEAGWSAVLQLVRPTSSLVGSYLWHRLQRVEMTLFRVVLDPPAPPIAGS